MRKQLPIQLKRRALSTISIVRNKTGRRPKRIRGKLLNLQVQLLYHRKRLPKIHLNIRKKQMRMSN